MEQQPSPIQPLAGEVWDAFLDPTLGREQSGRRPVLVISNDWFNTREGQVIIAVPITGTEARVRYQIEIPAGEGGVIKPSTILPEQIRALDISRFRKRRGQVSPEVLDHSRKMVRMLISD